MKRALSRSLRCWWPPINYKNLDYEIETEYVIPVGNPETLTINYKNLDYEIETMFKQHSVNCPNVPINYKNLDYEIET